jgi:hypothetical protein
MAHTDFEEVCVAVHQRVELSERAMLQRIFGLLNGRRLTCIQAYHLRDMLGAGPTDKVANLLYVHVVDRWNLKEGNGTEGHFWRALTEALTEELQPVISTLPADIDDQRLKNTWMDRQYPVAPIAAAVPIAL